MKGLITKTEWWFLWRFTLVGMIIIHFKPLMKWTLAVIEFGVNLAIKMIVEG